MVAGSGPDKEVEEDLQSAGSLDVMMHMDEEAEQAILDADFGEWC
jgi:hypothetical protein